MEIQTLNQANVDTLSRPGNYLRFKFSHQKATFEIKDKKPTLFDKRKNQQVLNVIRDAIEAIQLAKKRAR